MIKKIIVRVITLLLMLLWVYSAVSKLLDYNTTVLQFSQSPFITEFAGTLAWAVPGAEIAISVLLFLERTRRMGLYASLFLIAMFSAYIYAMLNMSSYVPCACGGVLSSLGWEEHLVLNLCFLVLSALAITLSGLMEIPELII